MPSPSPPRDRTRSPTRSPVDRSRSRSPRRSISPRSHSPSRSPRRNGRRDSLSRSRSRSLSRRARSNSRSLSRGRSPTPVARSTKVGYVACWLYINSDFSQIVVEKLTKNVTVDHLTEIFGAYGQIRDLDVPLNRQCEFPSSSILNKAD